VLESFSEPEDSVMSCWNGFQSQTNSMLNGRIKGKCAYILVFCEVFTAGLHTFSVHLRVTLRNYELECKIYHVEELISLFYKEITDSFAYT
jgi:hypothetical protein